jgi:hypothetical protein
VDRTELTHTARIASFPAHAMGTNSLSARLLTLPTQSASAIDGCFRWDFIVCSGGDDQSLSVCRGCFRVRLGEADVVTELRFIERTDGAAGSAIKGVETINLSRDASRPRWCCLSVGYDQRLSAWYIDTDASLEGDEEAVGRLRVLNEKQLEPDEAPSPPLPTGTDSLIQSTVDECEEDDDSIVDPCEPTFVRTTEIQTSRSLRWLCGTIVNVGDVGGMACSSPQIGDTCSSVDVAVIGEGAQLLVPRWQG